MQCNITKVVYKMQENYFIMIYFFLAFQVRAELAIIKAMSFEIQDLIVKFLKYQGNINSFSELTLKAYKGDLEQAFRNKQKSVMSAPEIWEAARTALNSWSSLSLASRNRKIGTL